MADEQNPRKDTDEDFEVDDALDYEDTADVATLPAEQAEHAEHAEQAEQVHEATTTVVPAEVQPEKSTAPVLDEYDDDEPIEDYVVKLVVNDEPEQSTSAKDLIDAAITDSNGNLIPSKTSEIIDAVNSYTSTVVDEIAGETTGITGGGKSWWSESTRNYIILGLIAICILGILLACLCLLRRKKSGGNKRPAPGSTGTTQNVVNKGVAPDQKYERVPNV